MMVQQRLPGLAGWSRHTRCWPAVSGVSSSSPVMPMTPFIGVRISWLMVARKFGLGVRRRLRHVFGLLQGDLGPLALGDLAL